MAAGLERKWRPGGRRRAVAVASGVNLASAWGGDDEVSLRRTEIAQPALVLTEIVLAAALPSALEVVAVAGHSVGEFTACVAAGALAPEDALRLVIERSRLMAAMTRGTMAAVLGLDAASWPGSAVRGRDGGGGKSQRPRPGGHQWHRGSRRRRPAPSPVRRAPGAWCRSR